MHNPCVKLFAVSYDKKSKLNSHLQPNLARNRRSPGASSASGNNEEVGTTSAICAVGLKKTGSGCSHVIISAVPSRSFNRNGRAFFRVRAIAAWAVCYRIRGSCGLAFAAVM
jgi:hypothetical protein